MSSCNRDGCLLEPRCRLLDGGLLAEIRAHRLNGTCESLSLLLGMELCLCLNAPRLDRLERGLLQCRQRQVRIYPWKLCSEDGATLWYRLAIGCSTLLGPHFVDLLLRRLHPHHVTLFLGYQRTFRLCSGDLELSHLHGTAGFHAGARQWRLPPAHWRAELSREAARVEEERQPWAADFLPSAGGRAPHP